MSFGSAATARIAELCAGPQPGGPPHGHRPAATARSPPRRCRTWSTLLDDEEPQVQRDALRAIMQMGTDEAFAALQAALTSGPAAHPRDDHALGRHAARRAGGAALRLHRPPVGPPRRLRGRSTGRRSRRWATSARRPSRSCRPCRGRSTAASGGRRSAPVACAPRPPAALRAIGSPEALTALESRGGDRDRAASGPPPAPPWPAQPPSRPPEPPAEPPTRRAGVRRRRRHPE